LKKTRKILRKLPEGGFFLHKDPSNIRKIDKNSRTKLWLSSNFLFEESLEKNPEFVIKTLNDLIEWNLIEEKYKECELLEKLLNSIKTTT
jgi:hypothetical protein